jgi:predicted RNase H-like HicB family nuclease
VEGDQMILEYIQAALEKARYDIIKDKEPFYAEIPGLDGVWATGKTLEECRNNLAEVLDGWIVVRLRRGLAVPPISGHRIKELKEFKVGV